MKELPKSVPFGDRLSALCAIELSAARGNPERIGAMIERLCNSLAFTLAVAAGGEPDRMSNLLEGASSYLFDTAGSHQKFGSLFGEAPTP